MKQVNCGGEANKGTWVPLLPNFLSGTLVEPAKLRSTHAILGWPVLHAGETRGW